MIDWSVVEAAHRYADLGWSVLPLHAIRNERCTCGKSDCPSPGKHPRTRNGVKDATTDHVAIDQWFEAWPDSNVGIATGKASGLVVVDVDPRNGGFESMEKIELPPTRMVETGGGGFHYLYAYADSVAQHVIATGVDVKADGGYIVAAPSNHISGGTYSWIDEAVKLAPAPPIALNGSARKTGPVVVEPDQKQRFADILSTDVGEGARNDTLTQVGGYLRNTQPEPVTRAILALWNQLHVKPPLAPDELSRTIKGLYQRYPGLSTDPYEFWTARSLLSTEFPELTWVVKDLLPEGLCFLAGRPKRGKSWLALQIAIDVVTGGSSLGTTSHGKVLYLALEDSPRRIKTRLQQMRAEKSDDLFFLNTFPQLDQGGYNRLMDLMEQYRPILVVVDTLARVQGRKRDGDSNADMTDLLSPLQALALEAHCAILMIDHHRKPGQDPADMIDDIAGSTAKTAVADAILGLYRKSGDALATLKITGRDVEERDIPLLWDSLQFHWRLEKKAELTVRDQRVIQFVDSVGEADINVIATHLGLTTRAIQEDMADLVARGLLGELTVPTGTRGRPRTLYTPANKGKS